MSDSNGPIPDDNLWFQEEFALAGSQESNESVAAKGLLMPSTEDGRINIFVTKPYWRVIDPTREDIKVWQYPDSRYVEIYLSCGLAPNPVVEEWLTNFRAVFESATCEVTLTPSGDAAGSCIPEVHYFSPESQYGSDERKTLSLFLDKIGAEFHGVKTSVEGKLGTEYKLGRIESEIAGVKKGDSIVEWTANAQQKELVGPLKLWVGARLPAGCTQFNIEMRVGGSLRYGNLLLSLLPHTTDTYPIHTWPITLPPVA